MARSQEGCLPQASQNQSRAYVAQPHFCTHIPTCFSLILIKNFKMVCCHSTPAPDGLHRSGNGHTLQHSMKRAQENSAPAKLYLKVIWPWVPPLKIGGYKLSGYKIVNLWNCRVIKVSNTKPQRQVVSVHTDGAPPAPSPRLQCAGGIRHLS